jgi:oligosaccharide reducing-end xylanase
MANAIAISRRSLVKSGVASAASMALVACGGGASEPDEVYSPSLARDLGREQAQATPTAAFTSYWTAIMGSTSTGGALLKCGALVNNVNTEAYILDANGNSGSAAVKSEGQSYGMMLAVLNNQPDMFKKLWTWVKNHMLHGSAEFKGRLAWLCRAEFTAGWKAIQTQSAPDGEIWMATALLMAGKKWSIVEYTTAGNAMCNVMLEDRTNNATGSNYGSSGNVPFFQNNVIRFVPQSWSTYTDPSYAAPAFFSYLAGAHNNGTQGARWNAIETAHRKLLVDAAAVNTQGICAEFTNFNGTPYNNSVHFADAWRVTMMQVLDKMWTGNTSHNAKIKSAVDFLAQVNYTQNQHVPQSMPVSAPSYTGAAFDDYGQMAMYSTASLADVTSAQKFVTRITDAPSLGYTETAYYQGLLCLLALAMHSGKFGRPL